MKIKIMIILIMLLAGTIPAKAQVGNPALYIEPGRLVVEWFDTEELWTNWNVEVCLDNDCFLFKTRNISRVGDTTYFWDEYCRPSKNGYLVTSAKLIEKIGSREIGMFFMPGSVYYPFCNHAWLPLVESEE